MFSIIGHDSTACVFSSSAFQPHPRGNSYAQCVHRKSINGALIHAYLHMTLGNIANISY